MKARRFDKAFSLVEVMVAIALICLLGLSLSGMIILSGKLGMASRQELTAAEIVEAKLEALRCCSWENLKVSSFVPTTFFVTNGIVYNGTIALQQLATSETYKSNLVQVSIQVNWTIEQRPRSLGISSFISPYGFASP